MSIKRFQSDAQRNRAPLNRTVGSSFLITLDSM
jgi:hypothetical protein